MKRMKKVFAVFLSLAMVLGMSMTAFAEDDTTAGNSTTITINNAGNGTFGYVQVIEADPATDTGWNFVEGYADDFTTAFGGADAQTIIKGMIYAENPQATEGAPVADFSTKYANALASIVNTISTTSSSSPITVTGGAGLYVIKGSETGFSYNPMAVFVGMNYESGKPSGVVTSASVDAKKAPTTITKEVNDKVVEVSQTVTYTVTSTVPFFPDQDTNRFYVMKDTISGAKYKLNAEGKVEVTVSAGTDHTKTFTADPSDNSDGTQSFTLDLTDDKCDSFLNLANNTYANQTITFSYDAVITGMIIDNDVVIGDGTNEGEDKYGSDHEDVISGTVTLTKKNTEEQVLPGAVFVVQKTDTQEYATFNNENYLTGWVSDLDSATELTTNESGTITVNGLAPDTGYEFKEVQAPDGYSINETNAEVVWDSFSNPADIDKEDAVPIKGTASMTDTKLASLPSTGGMGTIIFTVGGIVIMAAAVVLFFAVRRKNER